MARRAPRGSCPWIARSRWATASGSRAGAPARSWAVRRSAIMATRDSKVSAVSEDRDTSAPERQSPVERRIGDSLIDRGGVGKPLSRRTRQTRRSVEAYLAAGVMPRYMERLREIETAIATERRRIERSYRKLREACGDDLALFERRWRTRA